MCGVGSFIGRCGEGSGGDVENEKRIASSKCFATKDHSWEQLPGHKGCARCQMNETDWVPEIDITMFGWR